MDVERKETEAGAARATGPAGGGSPGVRWDDSNMRSLYANVAHVTGSREEIVLLFGIHHAWHGGQKEVTVQLLERVMLNPYAAKRLSLMLGQVLKEYESRFGQLNVDPRGQGGPGESLSAGR